MKTATISNVAGLASGIESLGEELRRAFAAVVAGARASRDYERLSRATDATLARQGLTRDGIARAVLERHLG